MRDTRQIEAEFSKRAVTALADYLFQEVKIHPARGDYRVVAMTSGPRLLTVTIAVNPRYAPKVIGLSEQLSMAAGLDGNMQIRIGRGPRGTLAMEIPKPEGMRYELRLDRLPRRRGLNAPIGVDLDHRPATLDFAHPMTPHLLIAGTTGSGKTNTGRLFVYDLASQNEPEDVGLLLLQTAKQGLAWRPFERLPHLLHPVVTNEGTALQVVMWANAEINRRANSGQRKPAVFLCIDEAHSLLSNEAFVRAITGVTQTGRELNFHVMLITQDPTAAQMGSSVIKGNIIPRVLGRFDSAAKAAIAAGLPGTGAELLTGPGDQLLLLPTGIRRVTSAHCTEADMARLPASEQVIDQLELDEYEDVDHVLDQADGGQGQCTDDELRHMAYAMAHYDGDKAPAINWLQRQLRIGGKRATRIQHGAQVVIDELERLGHSLIPHTRATVPGSVTQPAGAGGEWGE